MPLDFNSTTPRRPRSDNLTTLLDLTSDSLSVTLYLCRSLSLSLSLCASRLRLDHTSATSLRQPHHPPRPHLRQPPHLRIRPYPHQINRYAFSGGQDSVEKYRELGANLEVFGLSHMLVTEMCPPRLASESYLLLDVLPSFLIIDCPNKKVDISFKYLSFCLDYDDKLEEIRKEYGSGCMLTGEVKQLLVEVLTEMVERHGRARAAVTDEMVDALMAVRPLVHVFSRLVVGSDARFKLYSC